MYRVQSRPLWQNAGGGPSLVLDFIANPVVPAGWTFSRASTATWFDAQRVMRTAALNVARFDHDPATGAALGLRLESAMANLIPNSAAVGGAGWRSISTLVTLNALEAPDTSITASVLAAKLAGTTAFVHTPIIAIGANNTYAVSTWMQKGSAERSVVRVYDGSVQTKIAEVFLAWSGSVPSISNTTGVKGPATITPSFAGGYRLTFSFNSALSTTCALLLYPDADNGVESTGFCDPQLETGSFPSSYFETTGAAGTRTADFMTTSDLSWLDPQNGTLVFGGTFFSVADGGMFAFSLDDNANNGIGIYKINGSGALAAYSGSSGSTPLGLIVSDGQRFKAGIAWSGAGASASASANGNKSLAVAGAQAVKPAELCLGGARNHQFASNVLVRSLTYWSRRLDDAELAGATTL
ncbi:phage head spike fiber domain-containing protein [Paraburkholderia acidisoli]|uniref:Concanavalin A-like lectin/glucanase superfamily protein n=1 Tax=Paraburkholderia acidisoli TaxID=2571748 RepID=A0A7Z2GMK7_9BURK|nr:hypothetical protein [Paraburkholderia acidisoli]QGZ64361.1 hypothetical protein FAZ98_21820 [Paraburkholderia acidisoli]